MTHVGKIGRLPKELRDTLGHWIEDGKPGKTIVRELNALPCVQQLCQTAFGGKLISEQNLSDWKSGGHLVWLRPRSAEHCSAGTISRQPTDL